MAAISQVRSSSEWTADGLLEHSYLAAVDRSDLEFAVATLRSEKIGHLPLNVDLEGVSSTAIIWVREATSFRSNGEDYLLLNSRLTDVVTPDRWATHLDRNCALIVPIEAETNLLRICCYLLEAPYCGGARKPAAEILTEAETLEHLSAHQPELPPLRSEL